MLLLQPGLSDAALLPFPTPEFGRKGTYKVFGVVTDRKDAGDQVICWLCERCGKSKPSLVMESESAGGELPSGQFGANAAR